MIALIASAALVLFLLVPGFLFKSIFSLFIPLDKFNRTRSEELSFSAFAAIMPFALTFLAVTSVGWFGNHPFFFPDSIAQGSSDYRSAFASRSEEHTSE